jgi:hypothetical protein
MTSPENFVLRWARLKRSSDIQRGTEVADDRPAEIPPDEIASADHAPVDPASLPSIEAIDVNTDIRGFLQSWVPAELTRAALRQAWTRDPGIRDFIGIAENQWDFNNPDAISGFGPLPEGFDVSGLLSQALGGRDRLVETIPEMLASTQQLPSVVTDREPANPGLDAGRSADDEFRSLEGDRSGEIVAPENQQASEANDRAPNHCRHGSALPRLDG